MAAPEQTQVMPVTNSGQASFAQNALIAYLGRCKDAAQNLVKERKPWSEMFDRTSFAKPESLSEATGRLRKNITYFKVNYAIFILATTGACFLASGSTLLALLFLVALWLILLVFKPGPITIAGRTFGEREKFIGLSVFSLVVTFFLSSIGAVLFYALALGTMVVAAHGAFRVPDDLFLDEPEAATGFLSFLNIPSTAHTAGPATIVATV